MWASQRIKQEDFWTSHHNTHTMVSTNTTSNWSSSNLLSITRVFYNASPQDSFNWSQFYSLNLMGSYSQKIIDSSSQNQRFIFMDRPWPRQDSWNQSRKIIIPNNSNLPFGPSRSKIIIYSHSPKQLPQNNTIFSWNNQHQNSKLHWLTMYSKYTTRQ